MKKYKILTVFAAVAFAFASNGYSDGNVNNSPKGFVRIPAGTFKRMDERDVVQTVTLTKAFFMCKHEVTQKEYQNVMGTNPSKFKNNPDKGEIQENRPVEGVSWLDAIEYCNRRSAKEGLKPCYKFNGTKDPGKWGEKSKIRDDYVVCDFAANGYRLPTDAEWEYAARAGNKSINIGYSGGTEDWSDMYNLHNWEKNWAELGDYAWYVSNSRNKTHEVKKKKPNAFGLYDMTGNVFEWCWDMTNGHVRFGENVKVTDPIGAESGGRVLHGGAWCYGDRMCNIGEIYELKANYVLSEQDAYDVEPRGKSALGFRVVRTDTSTVTPAHQKQVKEQEEKVAERIKKDEEQYKENKEKSEKFMEGEMVKIAKQLLANNIPPEVIASMTGLDVSEINKLLESDKN